MNKHAHPAGTADETIASKLAALSHPARLQLIRCLGESDACCVKELVWRVGLAQSTVSQHIKVLLDAGLVSYRPERQSSRYSLDREALTAIVHMLGDIVELACGGKCAGPRDALKIKGGQAAARPRCTVDKED